MEWDSHATYASGFPAWGAPGDYRTVADLGPMTSRKSYATDLTVDQYLEGGAREVNVPTTSMPTFRMQAGAGDMGDPSVGTVESERTRADGQPTHAPVGGSRAHAFSATSSRWDQARASGAASAPLTSVGASVSGARDLWTTGGVGVDAYASHGYDDEFKPGYMMHTSRSLSQPFAPRATQRGIPPPPMTAQPPRKMPLPAVRSGCARFNTTPALATRHGHPDFNNTFSHAAGPMGSNARELAQFTLFEAPRYAHRAGYTGGRSHYKQFKPVVTPHASSSVEGSGGADPPSLTSRRQRTSATASVAGSSTSTAASASLSRGIAAVPEATPTTLAAAHATQLRQHPVPRIYDMPVPSVDPLSPSPVVAVHNMNTVGKRKTAADRKHRGTSRNVLGGFYTS